MTEEELKQNIAKNIASLRKKKGMTQAELAEAINYSDKSVSKWERGDGIPDVFVISKIAELFDVTLNDLISEKIVIKKKRKLPHLTNRIIIPLLSIGLVFLVFSLIFLALEIFAPNLEKTWLSFILALPISCIPLIVFSMLWWDLPQRFVCVTALVWTTVLFLCLAFENDGVNFTVITAAIFQVLVILWFVMRYRAKKRKQKRHAENADESEATE